MKKPLLIITIILVIILIVPVINLLGWAFQEKKPMNIVILDKTVPSFERRNHRSLVYTLTNERFVKKDRKGSYSTAKDYYGFFPKRPVRERQFQKRDFRLNELMDLAEKSDALYYADTYGVYFNDWYQGINNARRSRKLYGGLNNTDYLLFAEMKKRDKLVILEYNTFDYPTAGLERYKSEGLLGITSTGWTGKYYQSLDSLSADFPIWLTSMYRNQYSQPWTFKKAGIVLLKENGIIVLEEGVQLKSAKPVIKSSTEFVQKYKLAESVTFTNAFDIIDPGNNTVISSFNLNTLPAGDTILAVNGLSNSFPAAIQEPQTKHTYYFSGDFTNNKIPYWTSRLKYFEKAKFFLYSDNPDDSRRFYWLYYKPLINGILTEYQATAKK
jgi:hypothetical protein